METVKHNGRILAYVQRGTRYREGLDFITDEAQPIQVGTWAYNNGHALRAHRHKENHRTISRTQEFVIVTAGRIMANVFSDSFELLRTFVMDPGDFMITLGGGHSFMILADGTRVVEVKNGPYTGLEADKETAP